MRTQSGRDNAQSYGIFPMGLLAIALPISGPLIAQVTSDAFLLVYIFINMLANTTKLSKI